jgi:hypothetical protein
MVEAVVGVVVVAAAAAVLAVAVLVAAVLAAAVVVLPGPRKASILTPNILCTGESTSYE